MVECALEDFAAVEALLAAWAVDTANVVLDVRRNSGLTMNVAVDTPLQRMRLSQGMISRAATSNASAPCEAGRVWTGKTGLFEVCEDSVGGACVACDGPGAYLDAQVLECRACAAGGFYQDQSGNVGTLSECACKLCPAGTFSATAGATGSHECQKCPDGTDGSRLAGYRACPCQPGHYRLDRFGPCLSCRSSPGVDCRNDVRVLLPGYWWGFASEEHRQAFEQATASMLREDVQGQSAAALAVNPPVYACPQASACQGGVGAACATGYEGVLCSECADGYFEWLGKCSECPSRGLAALFTLLIACGLALLFAFVLWQNFKVVSIADGLRESFAMQVVGKAKIVLSYLVVIAALYTVLSSVRWPNSYRRFLGALQFVSANPMKMLMPACLNSDWQVDSYQAMTIAVALPPAVLTLLALLYRTHLWRRGATASGRDRERLLAGYLRSGMLIVFLLYPIVCGACFKILLPCNTVCTDQADPSSCASYLQGDYSVECSGARFERHRRVAAAFGLVYAAGVPLVLLWLLVRERPWTAGTASAAAVPPWSLAMRFFYEDYQPRFFFWELIDMVRKLLLTSIIMFVGQADYTQLAVGTVLATVALVLHSIFWPFEDRISNRLQFVALASIAGIYIVGGKLHAEQNDGASSQQDQEGLGVLLILVSLLTVIGLVAVITLHAHLAWRNRRRTKPDTITTTNPVFTAILGAVRWTGSAKPADDDTGTPKNARRSSLLLQEEELDQFDVAQFAKLPDMYLDVTDGVPDLHTDADATDSNVSSAS